jgi:hypothetical protein
MNIEFEWQIIEGEGNETETITSSPPIRPKRRLPKWLIRLAAIPVLAVVIFGAYMVWTYHTQLNRATREVSLVAKAEERAIAANDQASFMALQDPDDPAWRTMQERRFGQVERLGIPELGLRATGTAPQFGPVSLEPGGARLDMLYQFSVMQPMPSGPVTVSLRVPQFYKQTPSGWVRARPSAEFWGSLRSLSSKRVLALYSRRDADIVEPLVPNMAQVVERACANLACPPQVTITFETSPDSAGYRVTSTYGSAAGDFTLRLASPYLSGLPMDTASRDELYRALETRLVRGLVAASWPGQRPSWNSAVYQQLVRWHLAQAGLAGPFITPEITHALVTAMQTGTWRPLTAVPLQVRSSGTEATLDEAMISLAFAFLAERLGATSLSQLTPAMADSTTLGEAIRTTLRMSPVMLEPDWQRFLRAQAGLSPVAEAPAPNAF